MEIKKEKFLNLEEADNLQDMINYAASIKDNNESKREIETRNKEEDIKYINKYDEFKHTVLLHPSNEKLRPYEPYNIKISGMTPHGITDISNVKYTSERCQEMCNEDDECGGFYYGKV